jgi:hypothetical protein
MQLKEYVLALFHGWVGIMSGLASVILLFLPLVLPGLFADSKAAERAVWIAAAGCFFIATYSAWLAERAALEQEKAKNEAEPHIRIDVLSVVTHGSLGSGMTDLFFTWIWYCSRQAMCLLRIVL